MADLVDALEARDPAVREHDLLTALPALVRQAQAAPGWAGILRGVAAGDLTSRGALAQLPVTRKSDLKELQQAALPFGGLNSTPTAQLSRIFMSPGPIFEIDPDEPDRFRKPDAALVGDAATQLRALIAALPKHNRARASRAQELKGHRAWFAERLSRLEPQLGFLKAIRAALPEDGIFVDEVSQMGFASRVALPIEKPRTYLSPGYQDNLGWGFGTALGAKAAMPHRKVLAIAGDGGFMYQVGELATAARHNLAVVVVVFDNGAFGNVKRIQQQHYGNRLIASDLQNPDFGKLADSFGIASFKATDPRQLEEVLHKAFALNAPALVWVPHGDVPSPWDMIMMPRVR